MKSINWIDKLIAEKNLPSDRQAALLLGMSSALMSNHRKGKAITLDDKYAYKLEELLNLPHGKIVADQHAERASDPNISAMWRKLAASAASFSMIFFQLGLASNVFDITGKNILTIQHLILYLHKLSLGPTGRKQNLRYI